MSHLLPELQRLVAADDRETLDELCDSTPPALMAEMLEVLEPQDVWKVIAPLTARLRAEIFGYLQPTTQLDVVERIGRRQLASLMDSMEPDDRTDFFKRLDETVAEEMLPLMARADRQELRRLAAAEEGTVGSVMNTDYVTLPPDVTAGEALVMVRQQAPDSETIYYTYVIDADRKLVGFVSLKDLILSRPSRYVRDLMKEQVISVPVTADQEEAATTVARYDLVAVPVVDGDGRLLGIVTHDDVLDIVREEEAEDLEHFMGMTGPVQELPYLQIPFWVHYRRRVTWIVGLLAVGLSSGAILKYYEASDGIGRMYQALTIYVPMLINTGGNAGQQSVTTVMRALILEEIRPRDVVRVVLGELATSALLAISVALVVYFGVLWLGTPAGSPSDLTPTFLAGIVTLALGVHIVVSALVGALLPLAAAQLKLDPTLIASPALTTLADILGLVIYFGVAALILT
ncbi:MAG: magnesium transporter [Planctomycetota bacterium]